MLTQIKLEQFRVQLDATKYYTRQDKLRTNGLGDQVDSHSYLIKSTVLKISDTLEEYATNRLKGVAGKHNALLRTIASRIDAESVITYDYPAVAFIGLQAVFQALSTGNVYKATWNKIVHTIAARLEADHKARLFEAHEPQYFAAVMKSFQKQAVQQYQHKHRVLMMKFNEFEISWHPWTPNEKIQVANRVLIAILDTMPTILFKTSFRSKGKTVLAIDTSVEADLWFAEFERERGFLKPSHPPLIEPPLPWVRDESGIFTGGYHTLGLAKTMPFVKTKSNAHKEFLLDYRMEAHRTATNKLQATSWQVNTDVLSVQREMFRLELGSGLPHYKPKDLPDFPIEIAPIQKEYWTPTQQAEVDLWKGVSKRIHTENRLQKGKVLTYKSILDTAMEYKDYETIYFVYNACFRGRLYCATAGLSTQGEDTAKGLLTFATALPSGDRGLFWLAIHGANTFGYDKASNKDRVKWVHSRRDVFKAIIKDPISTRHLWNCADKPWQHLAFIYAWASTAYGENPATYTSLPIALDGSCNGIQHYSALLRDRAGGESTNLVNAELPADIYNDVSKRLYQKLVHTSGHQAEIWKRAGFDRKLTKKPVMTLPYGATRQSCKEYIYMWMLDHRDKFPNDDRELFKLALFLTALMWQAITDTVIAATEGMNWLRSVAAQALREGRNPIWWLSPVDFPVFQDYRETATTRITTMIAGSLIPKVRISSTTQLEEVHMYKQRTAIPPNFIHSIDAAHLVRTVNETDFTHYAMIHDDFGTHAANTQELWTTIRKTFVDMHSEANHLELFQNDQQLKKPLDLPPMGELDINSVLESEYFFG